MMNRETISIKVDVEFKEILKKAKSIKYNKQNRHFRSQSDMFESLIQYAIDEKIITLPDDKK
ncbi:MAG: hypothetical protein ACFFDN_05250 [Candidatus Hodarchaeota archaeon]